MWYIIYMSFKTGSWGEQAKARSTRRKGYFRDRTRKITDVKNTIGYEGEVETMGILGLEEQDKLVKNSPADFEYKGKFIDTKTSSFLKRKAWQFTLNRQRGKTDYFLCICKDILGKTRYMFLIPDEDVKVDYLWISEKRAESMEKYLIKGGVFYDRNIFK